MTKISRIKVQREEFKVFLNDFWNVITVLESKEQVMLFLQAILTHTEIKMIAKRIQIAKMLLEGNSYQTIRNYVKVTDSTISKISNILETKGDGLIVAIEYLQKLEKDTKNKGMRIIPDPKERYGMYFIPEKVGEGIIKNNKSRKKRNSIKKSL